MESAYDLFQKGKKFLESGHPAQAAVVLEKVQKLQPEKGSIREALGRAYYNYGRFGLAWRHFERAIRIDPTNHYAHFGLALCLERMKDKFGALRHIKLALAMAPEIEEYQEVIARLGN